MSKSLIIVLLCLSALCTFCSKAQKGEVNNSGAVSSNDYTLFSNTVIWPLAQAVKNDDSLRIRHYITVEKMDMNYSEPKFGNTLLMLTVTNGQYNSCRTLLELGADVNKHDTFNGASAIIDAAGVNNNSAFLKLLIKHGAKPNDVETDFRKKDTQRFTPLIKASSTTIDNVEALVESGADINYSNEYHVSPLSTALISDRYNISVYLLKKGCNFNISIIFREDKPIFIAKFIRENILSPKSKKYREQQEVITFLKGKGVLM